MSALLPAYQVLPVRIVRGFGSHLWAEDGTEYLDLYGGHAVMSIGHSHPHWVERVTRQAEQLAFYSNSVTLPIQEELGEALRRVSGRPDYRLFLCNSGAEANENAFKVASFATGRRRILAFTGAFHGRTALAMAATDGAHYLPAVNEGLAVDRLPFNDVEALESYFAEHGSECAAAITEGIQGVGGIRVASDTFLQTLRTLCTAYGAVLIADSVQCGFGRSGRFFAHDHSGIAADIYTMAKGMGNGFPVGGIFVAPHLSVKPGQLGTTFGGNPLACAAALAVLEVIESERLMERADELGTRWAESLRSIPGVHQVRGRGLMIGFDVPQRAAAFRTALWKDHHIFTGEAKPDTVRLLPALNLDETHVNTFNEVAPHLLA